VTQTVNATFVFADLAGFTALTEAHGDEQAAAVVADFGTAVRDQSARDGRPPRQRHR
jgi:class 3 adenylate cyclase